MSDNVPFPFASRLGPLGMDAKGQLISITQADGGVERFEYDATGNLIKLIDPLGRITTHAYDVLDRKISTTDPRGAVSQFAFDPVGNMNKLTDALANVTKWTYDSLNRVTDRTDPTGATERFIYDNVALACGCVSANGRGHLSEYVDKNGRQTVYKYDSRNRNTEVIYRDVSGIEVDRIFKTYDASSNLTRIRDNDSDLQFAYDLNSRLATTSNSGTLGVRATTLTNTWDVASNRVGVTDSDGVALTSTYDSRNLLSSRTWNSSNPVAAPLTSARVDFSYNGRGQTTSTSRFAGTTGTTLVSKTLKSFDSVGRTNVISHRSAVDAVLAEYDTDWNVADELSAWTVNSQRTNYQYDLSGQLTSASVTGSPSNNESYLYDATGNRTGTGKVVGVNNRLLSDERFDYTYDGQGNTLSKLERSTGKRQSFTYDHENRMIQTQTVSTSGAVLSSVAYRYDALGRRIARTADVDGSGPVAPTTETFVFDGADVWLQADGNGSVTDRYMHGDGVDDPIARYGTGQGLAWYLTDHLGSVRAIANASGAIVDEISYDSFGTIVLETNAAWGDRIKFTGREWDPVAGLYYYRSRMYDPTSGRFLSSDQIGFAGGDTNLYRYVGNMPGAHTDPSGNMAMSEYGLTLNSLSRLGIAAAQGFVGYTFGYTCGYLQAVTLNGLEGAEAEFFARRLGLLAGTIDFAAGMSLNFKGSIGTTVFGVGLFASGALALTIGQSLVTNTAPGGTPDQLNVSASTICTAVSIAGGVAVGNSIPRGRCGAPKGRAGLFDSGSYPKPPGHNSNWNWGPATGEAEAGWRWFDPNGGEWRFHPVDKWHSAGHWDHNPWTSWMCRWKMYIRP